MTAPAPPHADRRRRHTWIGDDCPAGWRRVSTIDIADPADVAMALDRRWKIGRVYGGGTSSVAEPCTCDCYEEILP